MSLKLAKISFSIPPGQGQDFALSADFFRLELPTLGVKVGVNGGLPIKVLDGFTQRGRMGLEEFKVLQLKNEDTSLTATGTILFGTGEISSPGSVRTVQIITLGNLNQLVVNQCKEYSIRNTGTVGDIMVVTGGTTAFITPGQGLDFAVKNPNDVLSPFSVTTTTNSSAMIAFMT